MACWHGDAAGGDVRSEDLLQLSYCVAEKIEVEKTKLTNTDDLIMEIERKVEGMPEKRLHFAVFDVKHP